MLADDEEIQRAIDQATEYLTARVSGKYRGQPEKAQRIISVGVDRIHDSAIYLLKRRTAAVDLGRLLYVAAATAEAEFYRETLGRTGRRQKVKLDYCSATGTDGDDENSPLDRFADADRQHPIERLEEQETIEIWLQSLPDRLREVATIMLHGGEVAEIMAALNVGRSTAFTLIGEVRRNAAEFGRNTAEGRISSRITAVCKNCGQAFITPVGALVVGVCSVCRIAMAEEINDELAGVSEQHTRRRA